MVDYVNPAWLDIHKGYSLGSKKCIGSCRTSRISRVFVSLALFEASSRIHVLTVAHWQRHVQLGQKEQASKHSVCENLVSDTAWPVLLFRKVRSPNPCYGPLRPRALSLKQTTRLLILFLHGLLKTLRRPWRNQKTSDPDTSRGQSLKTNSHSFRVDYDK